MRKKIIRIMTWVLAAAVMLGMVSVLGGCGEETARETVLFHISKLNNEKELKFVIDYDDSIHTSIQKHDDNGKLIYMYNEVTYKSTNVTLGKRVYQNCKEYDLIDKTYYEIVMTANSSVSSAIPAIILLELKTTTFEKIGENKYLATVYPQTVLGDALGDTVFEYTITIDDGFVTEVLFAGHTTTISRDVGESIAIVESEFSYRY